MDDWLRDAGQRAASLWERADRAGAFLAVDQRVRAGTVDVEVVKTLADCTTTAVFYRAGDAMIHPDPIDPPELLGGGWHGTMLGDTHIAHFHPVLPERKTIVLGFKSDWLDDPEATMATVPVDRERTRGHERHAIQPSRSLETSGVRVSLSDAAAGVVSAAVTVLIEALDPNVVAIELGGRQDPFLPRAHRGPGPKALWRQWCPSHPERGQVVEAVEVGEHVGVSVSARASLVAEVDPDAATSAPPPQPEPAWVATALPSGQPLAEQGRSGAGGPPLRTAASISHLRFDPPPSEAEGIQVSLARVYVFRYGGGQSITVPAPRLDEPVNLTGNVFEWKGERVELLSWNPTPDGRGYSLIVRASTSDLWPDIRVIVGDSSASLWTHREPDGTIRCSLPRAYDEAFGGNRVNLALRMIGERVEPVHLRVLLT